MTLAASLSLGCSGKQISATPPESSPQADDCAEAIARGPIYVPLSAASQPTEWVAAELARSYVTPFECAWRDKTSLSAGLKLLQSQVDDQIPQSPLPFLVLFEGKNEPEEITIDGRVLQDAATNGVLTLYPALRVEEAVTAAKRKDNEPLGEDIPESRGVIDYGNHSYLRITQNTPPVRWPKDSAEPQKNVEIWNAKAKKWVKRTCY